VLADPEARGALNERTFVNDEATLRGLNEPVRFVRLVDPNTAAGRNTAIKGSAP
jgi:hypothetical protein